VESSALPGYKTSFHLYTVPGQVTYNATLPLVLRQADGVVFVADSQMDRQRENIHAFQSLEANLRLNGSSIDRLPLVLQYNKRDLPNIAPVEYLEFLMNNRPVPHLSFEADAKSGRNVLATLNAITQGVVANFQRAQELHRDVLREVVAA
jgi:signal recognition particle receptor subunit beta